VLAFFLFGSVSVLWVRKRLTPISRPLRDAVNLEGNVCNIRKLQEWLGHKDLASTRVYLKYVRGKDVQERLNNSELAGFAIAQPLKQSPQEIDRPSPA
jgi:hypothetical protein